MNFSAKTTNKTKTTTLKTFLMLSVVTMMMLVPGGIISVHAAPGDQLLTINNPTPIAHDYFSRSVTVTSTGDLLVSAYLEDTGAVQAGSVYLFDGTTGNLLLTINNPTPAVEDRFGLSVATTPTGDILIGAYLDDTGATNAGSAYLFDGTTGNLLLTINNPTPAVDDWFSYSVATTINGDLLVGGIWDDTGATNAGSAYLFDGTTGNLLLTINNPTPVVGDFFGDVVAVTSNGDILIGADLDDTGATNAGSAYLFDGTTGNLLLTINNPTPAVDDRFGYSIATTINENILIGAYLDDTDGIDAGIAYLFEGLNNPPFPPTHEIFCGQPESFYNVINGTNSADYLVGTNSPDLIFGNGGNDMINSRGDNNCIYAGNGNDFVLANKDGNIVYGGAGNDSILLKGTGIAYGEDGDDSIYIIKPSVGHLIDGGNNYDLCTANGNIPITTANCEVTVP